MAGRLDVAAELARRYAGDPVVWSSFIENVAVNLALLGRYDDAVDQLRLLEGGEADSAFETILGIAVGDGRLVDAVRLVKKFKPSSGAPGHQELEEAGVRRITEYLEELAGKAEEPDENDVLVRILGLHLIPHLRNLSELAYTAGLLVALGRESVANNIGDILRKQLSESHLPAPLGEHYITTFVQEYVRGLVWRGEILPILAERRDSWLQQQSRV